MTPIHKTYSKYYEKALKYSYISTDDAYKWIDKDRDENHHYNPKDGSQVILADALEENDLHHDQETLDHLRNHLPPYELNGRRGKFHARAVRPVYGNVAFLNGTEAEDYEHHLQNP